MSGEAATGASAALRRPTEGGLTPLAPDCLRRFDEPSPILLEFLETSLKVAFLIDRARMMSAELDGFMALNDHLSRLSGDRSPEELIHDADRAMYRAKAHCVLFDDHPVGAQYAARESPQYPAPKSLPWRRDHRLVYCRGGNPTCIQKERPL